jgi:putative serine protease PepD
MPCAGVTISANDATGAGTGSGEVIRTDGYSLTNHVISGAANGDNVDVLFSDGTSVRAAIAGRDILTDLAVLKVDPPFDLTAIKIGQSNSVHVGQPVVAMDTADQLIEHGTVTRATFGLEAVPIPPSAAASAGTPQGLFVQGSRPAARPPTPASSRAT